MNVVIPLGLTPADVISTTVPADEFPAWSAGVRYAAGDLVSTGSDPETQQWRALRGEVAPLDPASGLPDLVNEGIDPSGANLIGYDNAGNPLPNGTSYHYLGQPWWEDVTGKPFVENRGRMFTDNPAEVTEHNGDIVVRVRPQGGAWDALALFNLNADLLEAYIQNGPAPWSVSRTLRYAEPLSADFPNQPSAACLDLPLIDPALYPNATLRLRLSVTSPRLVRCGALVLGRRHAIGATLYGTEVGIIDYSRKERDTFGDIVVIKRGYTETVRYRFQIETATVGAARQLLAAQRAEATVFVGSTEAPETIVYGYYSDLLIPVERWSVSEAELSVESIVQDTPATTELTDRVVFIDPDGTDCVSEHEGQVTTLCVTGGKVRARVTLSVLDTPLAPGDSIDWDMVWLSGTSAHAPTTDTLLTTCGQTLPLLIWPPTTPVSQEPGVASIRATITRADASTEVLEPAVLTVSDCASPCALDPLPPEWSDGSISMVGLLTETTVIRQIQDGEEIWFSLGDGETAYFWTALDSLVVGIEWTFNGGGLYSPTLYTGWSALLPSADHHEYSSSSGTLAVNRRSGFDHVILAVTAGSGFPERPLSLDLTYGVPTG